MDVCANSGRSSLPSSLNPNAPFFVPAAFFATEDFSPEWWHLVQTSPAFREYWLAERFDPELQLVSDLEIFGHDAFFPDVDFEEADLKVDNQGENLPPFTGFDAKEVARMVGLKEVDGGAKQNRRPFSPLPYQAKPLKVTQPQKPALRKIQQPR